MRAKEFTINESVNLFEINMSPSSLRQLASGINARAGMEFEMIVPNAAGGDENYELEPNYDMDERAESISQVINFFEDSEYNTRRDISNLRDELYDAYTNWQAENVDVDDDDITDNIIEYLDEDEVREILNLDEDAEVGVDETREAAEYVVRRELNPFYDDARERLQDEWFQTDNEEDFLSDTTPYMTDVHNRYDIAWPHYEEVGGSDSGRDISEIADEFEQAIGRPVDWSESYHGVRRKPNTYAVEPDSSLEGDDSSDRGLEFVSPPLPIAEMIADMQKVKAWADSQGCYTNSSTGLHINVSVAGDHLNLDYVKLALLLGDEHVLLEFGRAGNTYAKSAMQKIRSIVKSKPEVAEPMLNQMRGHLSGLASKAIHSGITEKMISIHPKDGYIEFRSPGGDWLGENFDKIESTLLRFVVALDAAMDPNKYRQEYLTKLYKLLQVQSNDDPMMYFAKHAAGQLPTSALKSFIRQMQRTRETQAASKLAAQNFGPVTGPDTWVIIADGVPQFRIRAKTKQEASDKAREWVNNRSYEWRVEHSGQNIEVKPLAEVEQA